MEKKGFLRIGFIQNLKEYPQLIRESTGVLFYDYAELDSHIDDLWERREGIICFDQQGYEVSADNTVISYFFIDTGLKEKNSDEVLYAGFWRMSPSSLDDSGWIGVKIGVRDVLKMQLSVLSSNIASGLEQYTSVGSYGSIANIISELTNNKVSEEECKSVLQESFENACKENTLATITNNYDSEKQISFFPLNRYKAKDGSQLYIKMEKNLKMSRTTEWFGSFVVTKEELSDELLSFYCFHTGKFLFESRDDANNFYNALAEKAMKENWKWSDKTRDTIYSQPILKSYLEYTYHRLLDEDLFLTEDEKKIVVYEGKVYFNSGLLDRNFRQIIIVGDEEIIEKDIPGIGLCRWELISSIKACSHNEHDIACMFQEDELPAMASYFTDYKQVVFDAKLDIHTNDRHIFEDGVARGRLPKYQAEYERVKNDEEELERLKGRIARDFDSAKERAKLLAERNYKLAVPQFYKETGEIQFLLPIYLGEREEAEKPQCALVLSLDKTGRRPYYRGETILTLDMAYNNTRLIAKPDIFWLNELV